MAVTSFKTSSMTTGSKRARVWDQSSSPGNFESIATNTVGVAGASEVLFSNIPQTYTHLQIRCINRDNNAANSNDLLAQFNSDTGSNYSFHYLYGQGASTASGAGTTSSYMLFGQNTSANLTTQIMGTVIIDILDYRDTNKYKTSRCLAGFDYNGGGTVYLFSNSWRSTSAITSIKLYPNSSKIFSQYTQFALYGVKE